MDLNEMSGVLCPNCSIEYTTIQIERARNAGKSNFYCIVCEDGLVLIPPISDVMVVYEVQFWFGTLVIKVGEPTISVTVKVKDGTSKDNIVQAGLRMYGQPYPRTYACKVVRLT